VNNVSRPAIAQLSRGNPCWAGDFIELTIAAMSVQVYAPRPMGAVQTLDLLRQAKEIVFPTIPVPVDTEVRRNLLPVVEPDSPNPEWERKLDELDQRFYAKSDNLTPRLEAFAREQGLVSDQADRDS
jgi:Domain of unknown function (DUF4375)